MVMSVNEDKSQSLPTDSRMMATSANFWVELSVWNLCFKFICPLSPNNQFGTTGFTLDFVFCYFRYIVGDISFQESRITMSFENNYWKGGR
jgi:hypothetical protein